jgi:HlyD family secretion protein
MRKQKLFILFLTIAAGAAYFALDRRVWEGGLPDMIQSKGRIERNHLTMAGKFPGRVQELLAHEPTTVQEGRFDPA